MPEQILSAETISPWWRRAVIITLLLSFAILIGISGTSYNAGPPIPKQVVSPSGETIFTGEDYDRDMASHRVGENCGCYRHRLGPLGYKSLRFCNARPCQSFCKRSAC